MSLPNQRPEISPLGQQNVDNQMVGLVDLGNSSHGKRRKQRSDVWFNFEKYRDEDGKDCAKCNLCQKVFDGSSKKGTTHLKNHFKICQRRRNGGCGGDMPAEASILMNPIAIKEKAAMDQELNHLDMARKIIKEGVSSPNSIKAADIIDVYNEEKVKLLKHFEELSCRYCLLVHDAVINDTVYTCLMLYFIDDDWRLKKIIVKYIEGGQNSGKCLKNELLEWGIENNISSMVINGELDKYVECSNERENWFNSQGSLLLDSKLLCINSMEYILDDRVCIMRFIYCRMSSIFNYITSNNEKFGIAIYRAKSMGKEVTAEVIPTKLELEKMNPVLCDDNDSIEGLLKIALGLKEAFSELENIDPHFQSLNLTKEDWDQTKAFYEYYQELTDDTFLKRWGNYRTANMYFPLICSLYSLYTKAPVFVKDEFDWLIQDVEKCWCEYKLVLAVAAVLDPRFKMDIVEYWYKKIYGSECESQLTIFTNYFARIYNEYAKGINNFKSCTSKSEGSNSSISYKMLDSSGKPCKSSYHHDDVQSLNSELHLYWENVKFPLIEDFKVLEWWQDNTRYFPTLARMARDFLSIQISSISDDEMSEIYDIAELAETMNFDSDTVERAFICIKSWLWKCGI